MEADNVEGFVPIDVVMAGMEIALNLQLHKCFAFWNKHVGVLAVTHNVIYHNRPNFYLFHLQVHEIIYFILERSKKMQNTKLEV